MSMASSLVNHQKTSTSSGPKKDKVQVGVAKALARAVGEGLPIFSLSADLQGSTGMKAFHTQFPNNFLDVGVCESQMISMAVGMSKAGFIPVVDTFAAFGVTKGNLPLIMGSLSEAPVIAIFSHTGFQDAADGASHQSLTYLSAVSSIPHLRVVNLSTAQEAQEYIYQAAAEIARDRLDNKTAYSYVFFLGRENFVNDYAPDLNYELGKPQLLAKGQDAALVVTGPMVEKALVAREQLLQEGIEVSVINHPFINWTDFSQMAEWIYESSSKMVTAEDHQLMGGMASLLTHELKLQGLEFDVISLGVKGEFGQSSYTADELYAKHKLNASSMVEAVKDLVLSGPADLLDTGFIKEHWMDVASEMRRKWDSISEKDLEKVKGNALAMVSLVQEKFGISKEDAIKKVQELMMKLDQDDLKSKVEETAKKAIGSIPSLINQVKARIKK